MCSTDKPLGNINSDVASGLAGGVPGLVLNSFRKGNDAAAQAAQDKETAARGQQAAAVNAAQMTPQQLDLLDKQTSATLQNLNQQQQMMQSVNPALLELGHQTLAMLRGDSSVGAAGIYGKQRAEQETQLRAQLQASLGSGYENTTSGQSALANFQRQSAEGAYSAATSNIPTLSGLYGQGLNNSMGYAGGLNNVYANNTSHRLNAITGTGSQVIDSSGSRNAGDIANANTVKGLAGLGIQGAVAYASGGGSGGSGGGGFASGGNNSYSGTSSGNYSTRPF